MHRLINLKRKFNYCYYLCHAGKFNDQY